MKLSAAMQQSSNNTRRSNSFRTPAPLDATVDSIFKSPLAFFWLTLHALCCLISLVLGFRFSRLIIFLLFSTSPPSLLRSTTETVILPHEPPVLPNWTSSRVVVGRHGIRIRPWPHPNPNEVMTAHRLMERVQKEQRIQYGIKNAKTLIVVTPTYVRTFQTLHLTGLMHSLMLVPYDLVWIVVESGGVSNETASLLAKSGLQTIHVPFDERMPDSWIDRHRIESRMRIQALRIVREKRMDGIVMFADDSNMHSMELFDEIQSVKWIGAVSVGILPHSGNSDLSAMKMDGKEENLPVPVQGPACNSSGQLAGWHTFNSLPYVEKSAVYIDDGAAVLPRKLEWAGFVLNSRLVWKEDEDKPEWVKDLDSLVENGDEVETESPLSLLKDASLVEPLGKCGRRVLLWWLRVEARADSKFPTGWIIDPPLEVTVPAKRTSWPDAPPEIRSTEKIAVIDAEKLPQKARSFRSRHGSNKRKRESQGDTQVSSAHP